MERGFHRNLDDVGAMIQRGLVDTAKAMELFGSIEKDLERYPAIDPDSFRSAVQTAFGSGG